MFEKQVHPSFSWLTPVLLVISIFLNIVGLYMLAGNSFSLPISLSTDPVGVQKALLQIEYAKVGGRENYEIMTRAQQISINDPQNPSNIENLKQYIARSGTGTPAKTPTTNTEKPTANGTDMTPAEVSQVLSGATLEGNKNAGIVIIEYSDMECPYCVKQYHDTKLQESLKSAYGDAVVFAFKNNRGVNHAGTEAKALGALCAKKLGGDTAYAKFYHAVMDGTNQSTGVYPVSKLIDIAKTLGLDTKAWQSCVDNRDMAAQFAAETAQAKQYGLSGTPGTLILNVKTGKYATVEGAYPISEFKDKIDLLK